MVEFMNVCYLYIWLNVGKKEVKISQMLFYVQEGITEVWKNNILENLVEKEQEF